MQNGQLLLQNVKVSNAYIQVYDEPISLHYIPLLYVQTAIPLCPYLPTPVFANKYCTSKPLIPGNEFMSNTWCAIRCFYNYTQEGSVDRYCGEDGKWTGTDTICSGGIS